MINNKIYYSELHATARDYDQKLWIIPGLFFAVAVLIFENQKNFLVFVNVFGLLFLGILILLYNKANIFHISIQKKINEFDEKYNENEDDQKIKRISLTSMTNLQLDLRINELEKEYLNNPNGSKGARFDCIQKFLAKQRVSFFIRNIMFLIWLINFFFVIDLYFKNHN